MRCGEGDAIGCVLWHRYGLMKCQDETVSTMVRMCSLHQSLRIQNSTLIDVSAAVPMPKSSGLLIHRCFNQERNRTGTPSDSSNHSRSPVMRIGISPKADRVEGGSGNRT